MKLVITINDLETENPRYTTMVAAEAASAMGHEVWIVTADAFGQAADGKLTAIGRQAPADVDDGGFLDALRDVDTEPLFIDDADVLWLRNNPADDMVDRPWVSTAVLLFGQLASARGVIVVNDPFKLTNALNKIYFQRVPAAARPRTMISRSVDAIKEFLESLDGDGVVKPLQGSGGRNVFVVRNGDTENVNQMIEAISRDGFVVAQECLPEASEGDIRLFLMNGRPLKSDSGQLAAMRRVNDTGDARSNLHAGGEAVQCEVGSEVLDLAELVRPMLIADGMFLVGLDIVGDKLMEVNVFSPGGLNCCEALLDDDFVSPVIRALERKVEHKRRYGATIRNVDYATL